MADEMVWMRYPANGGTAEFPSGAAEAWAARGWERCEAPVVIDPALVEHVPFAVPQPDPIPSADVETKPAKKTEK